MTKEDLQKLSNRELLALFETTFLTFRDDVMVFEQEILSRMKEDNKDI